MSFSSLNFVFYGSTKNYRYWSFFKGLLFTFQCALSFLIFSVWNVFYCTIFYFVCQHIFKIFFKNFCLFLRQNNKLVIWLLYIKIVISFLLIYILKYILFSLVTWYILMIPHAYLKVNTFLSIFLLFCYFLLQFYKKYSMINNN